MSLGVQDNALQRVLEWAMERMEREGYRLNSRIAIVSDPDLKIMGYAKEKDGIHYVVVADWALDSEMLGGLVLHELSHIYAAERGAPTHRHGTVEEILARFKERDGLSEKEVGYLTDTFDHLQNITVDDIVFKTMDKKGISLTKGFFTGWVSERPSGNPALDTALLARNAFATASLKRHRVYESNGEMERRNAAFLNSLSGLGYDGFRWRNGFDWMERFLENARSDWSEKEFRLRLEEYFEEVVSLMREPRNLRDLR